MTVHRPGDVCHNSWLMKKLADCILFYDANWLKRINEPKENVLPMTSATAVSNSSKKINKICKIFKNTQRFRTWFSLIQIHLPCVVAVVVAAAITQPGMNFKHFKVLRREGSSWRSPQYLILNPTDCSSSNGFSFRSCRRSLFFVLLNKPRHIEIYANNNAITVLPAPPIAPNVVTVLTQEIIQVQSVFQKLHIDTFLIFCLTFGTNINSMLKKQQNITANATKTNDASCCDAITIPTGATKPEEGENKSTYTINNSNIVFVILINNLPNQTEFCELSQCSNSGRILISSVVDIGSSKGKVSNIRCKGSITCQAINIIRSTDKRPVTMHDSIIS
uniref:Uncharacterized protein n=1 Tax=Glossina austeni TaxID=7395 RepID=A0A1A9UIR2_GLOAU